MLLSAGFVFVVYEEALKCVQLGRSGEEAILSVMSLDRTSRRHSKRLGNVFTYTYTIEYAGYQRSFDTRLSLVVGGRYCVVYLPDDKKKFIFGTRSDTVYSFLWREVGVVGLLIPLWFFAVACSQIGYGIRALIKSKRPVLA